MDTIQMLLSIQKRMGSPLDLTGRGIGLASGYFAASEIGPDGASLLQPWKSAGVSERAWKAAKKQVANRFVYRADEMAVTGGLTKELKQFGVPKRKDAGVLTAEAIMDFEGVATSKNKDRDGDVIDPMGAEFDPKMPLLLHHNPSLPVGKLVQVVSQDEAQAVCHFAIKNNALGQDTAGLVEFGAFRLSIGFAPIVFKALDESDDGFESDGSNGFHITKCYVMETSCVTIPANVDAIITQYSRAKMHSDYMKKWSETFFDARPVVVKSGYDAVNGSAPPVVNVTVNITHEKAGVTKDSDVPIPGGPSWTEVQNIFDQAVAGGKSESDAKREVSDRLGLGRVLVNGSSEVIYFEFNGRGTAGKSLAKSTEKAMSKKTVNDKGQSIEEIGQSHGVPVYILEVDGQYEVLVGGHSEGKFPSEAAARQAANGHVTGPAKAEETPVKKEADKEEEKPKEDDKPKEDEKPKEDDKPTDSVKAENPAIADIEAALKVLGSKEGMPEEAADRFNTVTNMLGRCGVALQEFKEAAGESLEKDDLGGLSESVKAHADKVAGCLQRMAAELETIKALDEMPEDMMTSIGEVQDMIGMVQSAYGGLSGKADAPMPDEGEMPVDGVEGKAAADCPDCGGSGEDHSSPYDDDNGWNDCQTCGGSGIVDKATDEDEIEEKSGNPCPFCEGTGDNPGTGQSCLACSGTGMEPDFEKEQVVTSEPAYGEEIAPDDDDVEDWEGKSTDALCSKLIGHLALGSAIEADTLEMLKEAVEDRLAKMADEAIDKAMGSNKRVR